MGKTDKLNKLYDKWECGLEEKGKTFDIFVKDGIIEEDEFSNAKIKILFALKDLHLDEKGREIYKDGIDMREHVCDHGDGKTWNPVARWANALLHGNDKFEDITTQKEKYLNKIAFINLKKEAGRASVLDECVRCYTKRDWKYIREEIEIIEPNVIVAGSRVVFESLREFVFDNAELEDVGVVLNKKMTDYGKVFNAGTLEKPMYVVEYYHPTKFGRGACNSMEHHKNMLAIRKYLLDKGVFKCKN